MKRVDVIVAKKMRKKPFIPSNADIKDRINRASFLADLEDALEEDLWQPIADSCDQDPSFAAAILLLANDLAQAIKRDSDGQKEEI